MDLQLPPLASACRVTGEPFADGQRVTSVLVYAEGGAFERFDCATDVEGRMAVEGRVFCRWVHVHKVRARQDNAERALKLTAENLFVALAAPGNELSPEHTRLVQFLALMLERKRLLRPKGRTSDGERDRYEHAKSRLMYEVPVADLSPEFFAQVQEQLSVLTGGGGDAGA